MKKCLSCQTLFPPLENLCHACGMNYETLDGVTIYSPDHGTTGFKSSYFAELAKFEDSNFWFRARNQLIIWALKKYCPEFHTFLEIGCGTGYVLSGIARAFPNKSLQGSELFAAGLTVTAARLPEVKLMQMDARTIPFVEEFDSIGIFDVLEHIEEDEHVLRQIYQALKTEGFLILTVPQHQWLWGPADEYACHVRRYTVKELHHKLQENGFAILRSTSFVSSLLPMMILSRFLQKSTKQYDPKKELDLPRWLNSLFEKILKIDQQIIRMGCNLPVGGSRLVVAKKKLSLLK